MKLMHLMGFLTISFILSGCVIRVDAQRSNVHEKEVIKINANDLNRLVVESGAGDLIIKGDKSAQEITVIAHIATTKDREYKLSLIKKGSAAFLVSEHNSSGFWVGDSPHINLEVSVPQHLTLDIDDTSGDLSVFNINSRVEIEDDSGDIKLKNIQNTVIIEDASGDIRVSDVGADVIIEDASGDVWVSTVQGNVNIDDDSGELTIEHIKGMVTIADGSGDIRVKDTGGLTVTESGSGEISIEEVKGALYID